MVCMDHDLICSLFDAWVLPQRWHLCPDSYPSGNLYSGEWHNDLRHGEGMMRWLNLGQQYVGMWQNGVQVGNPNMHIKHIQLSIQKKKNVLNFTVATVSAFAVNHMISVLSQHGRGTHIWILSQGGGLQCFLSNQYTGDFVQGQRHGHGTFYYASGAIYEGEWRNNASLAKVHQRCITATQRGSSKYLFLTLEQLWCSFWIFSPFYPPCSSSCSVTFIMQSLFHFMYIKNRGNSNSVSSCSVLFTGKTDF